MECKQKPSSFVNTGMFILLGIMAVALALRLFHLGEQSLWYDEGYSVYLADKSLAQITLETAQDIQPPLYYYLLHVWMTVLGQSEVAVRGLSLLFGLLSLPLFYLLGKKLFSSTVGLLAAGLAALSPLYLWYSQETRMYTLLIMLTLCSSYLLWAALEDENPRTRMGKWIGVAVTLILALYTHYFAFFVLAFQVLYVLIAWCSGWRRFRLREVTVTLLAIVIAYLPWLPYLFGRYQGDVSYWEGRLKLDEAIRKIGIVFSAGESILESIGQWLALSFAVFALVSLVAVLLLAERRDGETEPTSSRCSRWARVTFLLLYLLAPIALLLLTTYWTPKFNPRYAMIASPPLFIILSAGIVTLFRARPIAPRIVALGITAFIMATMLYADFNLFFDIRFTKPDFRGAVHWVQEHQQEDEVVILTSGHAYPVFDYYYSGDNWYPLPEERTLSTVDVLNYDVARDLNRFLKGKKGAWLVLWQNEVVDPNDYLTMLLDQYAQPQPVVGSFYHVRLRRYTLPAQLHFPEEPEIAHPMTVNWGNDLTLLGYSPGVTETTYLYWEARRPLDRDYKISLRLKDAEGFNWSDSGRDCRLAALLYPTTRWQTGELVIGHYELPALPGTPPGTYELGAVVYAEGAPQALDVLDDLGAPRGKTVELGPVHLEKLRPATREQLGAQGPPLVIWNDEIALLGYRQDRLDAQAGDEVHIELLWEALGTSAVDEAPRHSERSEESYEVRLGWVKSGARLTFQAYPPAGGAFPTSAWAAGDLIRGQYSLAVPLDIEPGRAEIQVSLFAAQPVSAPFNQWFSLTSLNVQPTDRVFEPPDMGFQLNVNFEDKLELLGADISTTELKSGDTFEATLFWKALSRMETSYTVFVHLLDAENHIQAQEDRIPAAGNRPTTGWVPAEVIRDTYTLTVNPAAAPGTYVLEVGVYDAGDPVFPRLSVVEDGVPKDNRGMLTEIRVRP